ncbi:MAG: LamG domain-containing protein [Chthoniobacterales bacterium]
MKVPPEEPQAPFRGGFSDLFIARVLCAVALAIALLPYLNPGFYSDDVFNSVFLGELHIKGLSLWQSIVATNHSWMTWNGRLFPVGIVTGSLAWYFASGQIASRLLQISLIILNLFVCVRLLRGLTKSSTFPLLFLATIPAFFQARLDHDPMTSFSPLLQTVLLLILLAVLFFLKYLEKGRPADLFISLLCHTGALLTYELALTAIVIMVAVTACRGDRFRRRSLLALGGQTALFVAFLGASAYLRAHAVAGASSYSGTRLSLTTTALHAFPIQLLAAAPLDYLIFDPHKIFRPFPWPDPQGWILASLLFAATAGATSIVLRRSPEILQNRRTILLIGGSLWLVPTVLVCVSQKYQEFLRWGWGYLPVYVEFFGVAFIVAASVSSFHHLLRTRGSNWLHSSFRAAFSILLGAVAAGGFLTNSFAIEYQNRTLRYPREFIGEAARHGLFSQVPEGSVILREPMLPWDTAAFYRLHAGRAFRIQTPQQWLEQEPDTFFSHKTPDRTYVLHYLSDGHRDGAGGAILARLAAADYQKKGESVTLLNRIERDPVFFLREPRVGKNALPLIAEGMPTSDQISPVPIGINLGDRAAIQTGVDWKRGALPPGPYQELGLSYGQPLPFRSPVELSAKPLLPVARPDPTYVLDFPRAEDEAQNDHKQVRALAFKAERIPHGIALTASLQSRVELNMHNMAAGFGLAFRVRPDRQQRQYACLFSCYSPDFRGLSLAHAGGPESNQYVFRIGNGRNWEAAGTLALPADQWSLVILNLSSAGIKVYSTNGGALSTHLQAGVPALPPGEPELLHLGNWPAGDRPFGGDISHLTIADRPFSEQEIAAALSAFTIWKSQINSGTD